MLRHDSQPGATSIYFSVRFPSQMNKGSACSKSETPSSFLHGCLGIQWFRIEFPLTVVLWIHEISAGAMTAIHVCALQAVFVLLLDHAAGNVLFCSFTTGRNC